MWICTVYITMYIEGPVHYMLHSKEHFNVWNGDNFSYIRLWHVRKFLVNVQNRWLWPWWEGHFISCCLHFFTVMLLKVMKAMLGNVLSLKFSLKHQQRLTLVTARWKIVSICSCLWLYVHIMDMHPWSPFYLVTLPTFTVSWAEWAIASFIYCFINIVFFRVGTDIIYTLSCVWNFQQEMLVTTIRDGLLEVN